MIRGRTQADQVGVGFLERTRLGLRRLLLRVRSRGAADTTSHPKSGADRSAELARFYEKFEDFVDVVCDAAQYGPSPGLDRAYLDRRQWLLEEYPQYRAAVRAYFAPHVPFGEPDHLDRLIASSSVADLLAGDDGDMITHIGEARRALTLYADHVRKLGEKVP